MNSTFRGETPPGIDVPVTVVSPTGTWSPTLSTGAQYIVNVSGDLTISFSGSLSSTTYRYATFYLIRSGYKVTFSNANVSSNVSSVISQGGSAGQMEKLFVEWYIDVNGNEHYDVVQLGVVPIGAAPSTLPSDGLVALYDFTSDFTDSVGSNDWTPSGATIISSAPHGVSIVSPNYLSMSGAPLDYDGEWTIFMAFDFEVTTQEETILNIGNWGNYPMIYWYLAGDLPTGKMRVVSKDSTGAFAGTVEVNFSDMSTGTQIWSLSKSSTHFTITQLVTDPEATIPYGTNTIGSGNYTMNQATLGARSTNAKSWLGGSSRPIYAMIMYDRVVTDPNELDSIYSWMSTVRGLDV